ncbi:Eukaryotic translation initiation factor [Arachis hypogaea]|nr:Eukaryotic translation initiation factor [Arachis hypogaea]
MGSENGDTVNYATVVREVKAYLKKGVAAKELQSHIAAFPVSAQEKMNALLEGLFDGVEKAFGKEATKRKNHLAAAVAGDDEGSQLLLLNAVEEFCYKKDIMDIAVQINYDSRSAQIQNCRSAQIQKKMSQIENKVTS